MDLDGILADGHRPVLDEDAHRHQVIGNELLCRSPNGSPSVLSVTTVT
jgi:hypothetical protein